MHVRCDNQYKTGADGGAILGQPMLFECMGICVLRPANEVIYLFILFKFKYSILDWIFFWGVRDGIFKTFLEESVDHIIYRDYKANRRSYYYFFLL